MISPSEHQNHEVTVKCLPIPIKEIKAHLVLQVDDEITCRACLETTEGKKQKQNQNDMVGTKEGIKHIRNDKKKKLFLFNIFVNYISWYSLNMVSYQ